MNEGIAIKVVDGVGHLAHPLYFTAEEAAAVRDRINPDLKIRDGETAEQWLTRTGETDHMVIRIVEVAQPETAPSL